MFKVGQFIERALVEMPLEMATQLAKVEPDPLTAAVLEGVHRDLAEIAERAPDLARSALAGSALRLALEMENPYNSATSKSMCAKALLDTLDRLRELMPPEGDEDGLDELARRRAERIAGGAAASH